jgi:hypothetical protein
MSRNKQKGLLLVEMYWKERLLESGREKLSPERHSKKLLVGRGNISFQGRGKNQKRGTGRLDGTSRRKNGSKSQP